MTAGPENAGTHRMGGEMTRLQRVVYRLLRAMLAGAMRVYFRHRVKGRANIPTTGAFILAPVHRSYLDTPLVGALTTRILRYMGKETMWEKGGFGAFFLTSMGGFPVQRDVVDRAALGAAREVLARGEPLVMFPEGTRRDGPVVRAEHMHDGPAFVASRSQVPVVPVGIGGSARAMPRGAKFVYPPKIRFVVGRPMAPPALVNGRVPRQQVRAFSDEIRVELQRLFDEAEAASA